MSYIGLYTWITVVAEYINPDVALSISMKNGQEQFWIHIDILYYKRMFCKFSMLIYGINCIINYNITTKYTPGVIMCTYFHLFIYIVTFFLCETFVLFVFNNNWYMANHNEEYRTHVQVLSYTLLMSLFISGTLPLWYMQIGIPITSPAVSLVLLCSCGLV